MNKNILLAAAALSVLATAGAANAASVSYRAGTGVVTNAATAPYRLASQLNYGTGVTSAVGEFDTIINYNTPLAAGTYTVRVEYSNATLNAAMAASATTAGAGDSASATASTANDSSVGFELVNDVDGAAGLQNGSTLTLTGGGSAGSNFAQYTLQVPAGATVSSLYFSPALRVTGPVSVTASATNQVTGQPVEPSVIQSVITTNTSAFTVTVDSEIGAGAGTDTYVAAGAAPATAFQSLAGGGVLGTVTINASGTARRDLVGGGVTLADVVGGTLTVTGDLSKYTVSSSVGTATQTGNTATIALPANPGATSTISVARTNGATGALPPSNFNVSAALQLGSTFASNPSLAATALEAIETEGLTYVVPWVSSATQGASTGSRTVIRISRIGGSGTATVYAQMLNPLRGSSAATNGYAAVGTLGNSGEVVLSSDTMQAAFGDFGRADFRLIVTNSTGGFVGNANTAVNNIVVKRVISQPNGGVSEMTVLAGDAGGAVPNDTQVPY